MVYDLRNMYKVNSIYIQPINTSAIVNEAHIHYSKNKYQLGTLGDRFRERINQNY